MGFSFSFHMLNYVLSGVCTYLHVCVIHFHFLLLLLEICFCLARVAAYISLVSRPLFFFPSPLMCVFRICFYLHNNWITIWCIVSFTLAFELKDASTSPCINGCRCRSWCSPYCGSCAWNFRRFVVF